MWKAVFLLVLPLVMANDLVSTMVEFEDELYALRDQVLKYYRNCDYTCLNNGANNQCAIDACESSFTKHPNSGVETSKTHGHPTECGNCEADDRGRKLDFGHSGVSNADINYKKTNINERRELACWTSQLDADWIENRNHPSLSWQYFGTPLGLHRTYPGFAQETCSSYDPRVRSWYVSATTGPKDVILVIDTSGSMSNEGRIELAQEAAISVVNTLTILDRFNVIAFNTDTQTLVQSTGLARATHDNKQKAVEAIRALIPDGGTYMEAAFDRAFQVLDQARTSEATTGCHKVILFLTDGEPSVGKVDATLEQHIVDQNQDDAVIFTYSLGSSAAQTLPKNIACQNNGIWTHVDDGSESLRTQMSYYYDYIASLRDADTNVVWVEPYIDAFGAGELTTAALAVYDNTTTPSTLVGVLGMDITVKEMKKLEPDHERFLDRFIQRSSPRCPALAALDSCAMEALRKRDYAKLDPDFIDIGDTAPSFDATCHSDLQCDDFQVAHACNGVVRSADWCEVERSSYLSETCIKECEPFDAAMVSRPHLIVITALVAFVYLYIY